MCGLSAILTKDIKDEHVAQLVHLHKAIQHRGPDGEGTLSWKFGQNGLSIQHIQQVPPGNVLFAHRRLSIIDVRESANQPLITRDQKYSIIFNGEIYNFVELKNELEAEGYRFQTTSDTEVLLIGYKLWGENIVHKIKGMYAFLILDLNKNVVFIARDPFGIKPLYFIKKSGVFYFSSDICALAEASILNDRTINKSSLYHYLRFGITDQSPHTFFHQIQSFPPAHYAKICLTTHQLDLCQYWKPQRNTIDISLSEAVASIRDLFLETLSIHMRSDTQIGATLSGGIDSSAIVMGMRHLKGESYDIPTFSYCASQSEISEEKWIDLVNGHSKAISHKTFIHEGDLDQSLDELIRIQGEPFGSTSIFAQFKVYQKIKDHNIKVALDGQGADEIFAGYSFFLRSKVLSMLKDGNVFGAINFLKSLSRYSNFSWHKVLFQAGASFLPQQFHDFFITLMSKNQHPYWIEKSWFKDNNHFPNLYSPKNIKDCLIQSLTETVLPSLLRYQDRNSMIFSVESRVPFLNKDLVDFTLQLPEEFFIRSDGMTKPLLREALKGILPIEIAQRRDKIGFQTPQNLWLNNNKALFQTLISMIKTHNYGFLNKSKTLAFLEGSANFASPYTWRLINLLKWSEIFNVTLEV
ncbi:MAG TPA: asparagine synthase (glutamine-hydrolyzing) [Candidatus Nitrosotenuis sp.]|jgi:asparagine synthase (glutamine-hydrolysing)|nr:asparagine synthase (glutamine-hydrolyzing) [Candidatus Nitrosotenuis sp.]